MSREEYSFAILTKWAICLSEGGISIVIFKAKNKLYNRKKQNTNWENYSLAVQLRSWNLKI